LSAIAPCPRASASVLAQKGNSYSDPSRHVSALSTGAVAE
jgi:hypothetical protein